MKINTYLSVVVFLAVLGASSPLTVEAQIFDEILKNFNLQRNGQPGRESGSVVSNFRDMMSVNVPVFYDMVRNGSSLGINVLSGLVKVERGEEAERSGLTGPRPLSVQVFGIPVYERGVRVRRPTKRPSAPPEMPEGVDEKENLPKPSEQPIDDEELPIIP